MSLDYDLRAIKDRDTSDAGWLVTQRVIIGTLTTGIGELTEKSAPEFYARHRFAARIDGTEELTPEQVQAHIGLKTNVWKETRAQFMRKFSRELDTAVRRYDREVTEKAPV